MTVPGDNSPAYFFFLVFIVISPGAWGGRRRAGCRDVIPLIPRLQPLSGVVPGRGHRSSGHEGILIPQGHIYGICKTSAMVLAQLNIGLGDGSFGDGDRRVSQAGRGRRAR